MEISLVKAFSWSLFDIDQTDIETLLPFVYRFAGAPAKTARAYCDTVSWL